MPDTGAILTMPDGWIDATALAELLRYSPRQARRDLSQWERDAADGRHAPRTRRWRTGAPGRPPLLAWADDVHAHLAIDEAA
jgi:hypothetical protein